MTTLQASPEFLLTRHDKEHHDETDIYGLNHVLVYEAESVDGSVFRKRAMVTMRVGGALMDGEHDMHTARYSAWTAYPLSPEETRIEGRLVTNVELTNEELETVSSALVEVLALRFQNNEEEA